MARSRKRDRKRKRRGGEQLSRAERHRRADNIVDAVGRGEIDSKTAARDVGALLSLEEIKLRQRITESKLAGAERDRDESKTEYDLLVAEKARVEQLRDDGDPTPPFEMRTDPVVKGDRGHDLRAAILEKGGVLVIGEPADDGTVLVKILGPPALAFHERMARDGSLGDVLEPTLGALANVLDPEPEPATSTDAADEFMASLRRALADLEEGHPEAAAEYREQAARHGVEPEKWLSVIVQRHLFEKYGKALPDLPHEAFTSESIGEALQRGAEQRPDEVVALPLADGVDHHVTIPLDDGREVSLPILGDTVTSPIWLPTSALGWFSHLARQAGEDGALTEEQEDQLLPHGRHLVIGAHVAARQRDGKQHHYVRARMQLATRYWRPDLARDIVAFWRRADTPEGVLETELYAVYDRLGLDAPDDLEDVIGLVGERLASPAGPRLRLRADDDGMFIQKLVQRLETEGVQGGEVIDCTLPLKQFGLLLDGYQVELPAHADALDDAATLSMAWQVPSIDKPRWVASRSFDQVWERANLYGRALIAFEVYQTGDPDFRAALRRMKGDDFERTIDTLRAVSLSPRAYLAASALEKLQVAQVLSVAVDVFEGAPEWESIEECIDWARQADLPFDPLYLDLTAPGGLCPLVEVPVRDSDEMLVVQLHGALLHKDGDLLHVEPVAFIEDGMLTSADEPTLTPYDFIGRVTFGEPALAPTGLWDGGTQRRFDTEGIGPVITKRVTSPEFGSSSVVHVAGLREDAWVQTIYGASALEGFAMSSALQMCVAIAFASASRALSVLAMLEAINIDVVDTPREREDERAVKRAEKRGWPIEIAKTVVVRPSKYSAPKNGNGNGGGREYSHAFWRRGHYAYYPLGTRVADKLAEENPKDKRLVDHPEKGLCRKVFRSPAVIGATDAAGVERRPIHKTRVWKDATNGTIPNHPTKETHNA